MYDTLGIPAGVYLFDRPVLVGPYGFERWEWDTDAHARIPTPCWRRSRAAATTR